MRLVRLRAPGVLGDRIIVGEAWAGPSIVQPRTLNGQMLRASLSWFAARERLLSVTSVW
jgi:hypothetical protein